jgi:hypothetical protein
VILAWKSAPVRFRRHRSNATTTTATTRVTATATIVIERHTPEQVWAFIRPAETAVLMDPTTVRAFSVPGTGPGLGEEQCFVYDVDGSEQITKIRITAEAPADFVEAVMTNAEVPNGSRWEVAADGSGTRLTASMWMDLSAGVQREIIEAKRLAAQRAQEKYVRRVKQLLECGLGAP